MALAQYLFEGGSEGTALTNANSGSSASSVAGGTHVFAAAAKAHGAFGFRATNASSAGTFRRYPFASAATPTTFQFSGVVTLPAQAPLQNTVICGFVNSSGTNRLALGISPDGKLRMTDVGSAHNANLADITWGMKYRIAIEAIGGSTTAAQVTAQVYSGTTSWTTTVGTPLSVSNWNMSTDSIVGADVGIQSSPGAIVLSAGWDDLQLNDGAGSRIGDLTVINSPPTVTVSPSTQNLSATTTASLTASASDSDGTIASHAWTFDYPSSGAPSFTGGSTTTPSFTTGSTTGVLYVARDTVTDNGGETGYDTAEVRVPTLGASTALPAYTPVGSAWTVAGGAADEGSALSDGSPTTYIESPEITSTPIERRWRTQPMTTRTGYRFILLGVSLTIAGSHSSKVRIYQGNTLITERATTTLKRVSDDATTNLTTTPTDLYLDLTPTETSAVTDPGDVWLAIQTVV